MQICPSMYLLSLCDDVFLMVFSLDCEELAKPYHLSSQFGFLAYLLRCRLQITEPTAKLVLSNLLCLLHVMIPIHHLGFVYPFSTIAIAFISCHMCIYHQMSCFCSIVSIIISFNSTFFLPSSLGVLHSLENQSELLKL